MLTFAPLLCITVLGADAASHQSISKGSNVQSTPLPASPRMTRRLKIFESFAKSDEERESHWQSSVEFAEPQGDCFYLDDDKTVNEILRHSLVELTEIIDAAKIHVIPMESCPESIESLIVFQSLLKMLSIPKQFASDLLAPSPWQKYLEESIRNLKCSVIDLSHKFGSNFKCDEQGRLVAIALCTMKPLEHLNLLMIPNTVEMLSLRRAQLSSISAWSDLRGKSLKSLRIYGKRNWNLKLNLDGLKGNLDDLSLEDLTVGRAQISEYFGLQSFSLFEYGLPLIREWMRSSTLLNLRIYQRSTNRQRSCTCISRDGTCTRE